MHYETDLPSVHLEGETITALEGILREGSTDPDLVFKLTHEAATYRFVSSEEFMRDVTLPAFFRLFEVVLEAREGQITLTADKWDTGFRLHITGDREWVQSRKQEIEHFFDAHGSSLRTSLERYLGIALAVTAVIGCLGLYYAGLGGVIGVQTPIDTLLFGALALITGGFLHYLLELIYPYTLMVTGTPHRRMLPYLAT